MVSLHPETIEGNNHQLVKNVLTALKKYKKYTQVFSYPNSDTGSNIILKEIKNYIKSNKHSVLMPSYGRKEYLHLLKYAEFLIGNSSSGFVEAPYLNTPTINVGTRQKGRPLTQSIFNASYACSSILKSIKSSLNYKKSDNTINYKGKNTINTVLRILKTVKLDDIKNKSFVDMK
jgi:UDP-N-acetylglucosamine 2-epimerase